MVAFTACLAGGLYSMAFIVPKPWCYVALGFSTLLVVLLRSVEL